MFSFIFVKLGEESRILFLKISISHSFHTFADLVAEILERFEPVVKCDVHLSINCFFNFSSDTLFPVSFSEMLSNSLFDDFFDIDGAYFVLEFCDDGLLNSSVVDLI